MPTALPRQAHGQRADFDFHGLTEYDTGFSNETDSFDEEVELLRCQADLVEAAAEMGGTTSADDDLLPTDHDMDDEEDGIGGLSALPTVRPWRPWQRSSVASVVIEEDEEGISSGFEDDFLGFEVGSSEIRSRLWAQSLLRLKRSIDEIYSLCEFESDEGLCEQVRAILDTASCDFERLNKQLESQHEYSLLMGDYPFKSGVAWTSRTPRASASRGGDSVIEQLERDRAMGSPSHSSGFSSGRRPNAGSKGLQRRSRSLDPKGPPPDAAGGGTGEAAGPEDRLGRDLYAGSSTASGLDGDENYCGSAAGSATGREDQLRMMVHSALRRIHLRLGQAPSRPSPEELLKRSEERQRKAQQLRACQDDQRMLQGRQTESRIMAARERRQEREQMRQRELLEKMTRARRQYQDQLRLICQRARKQNSRAAEVAYIAKEAIKSEREILKQKQVNAHLSRAIMREQMRKRLIESAERVARVSENRRKQLESWQIKVQNELEEKERLASQRRREHIHSIRLKSQGHESRSETVRVKRNQIQEEDEMRSQDFLKFKSKAIGRLALDCDGLPDAVREEVAEQLMASPAPAAGASRRASAPGAASARRKFAPSARACTPPPGASSPPLGSPKSSPPSAARAPPIEAAEDAGEEAGLGPLPEMPSLGESMEATSAAASMSPRDGGAACNGQPAHVEGRTGRSPSDGDSPGRRGSQHSAASTSAQQGGKGRATPTSRSPPAGSHGRKRGRSQGDERAVGGSDALSEGSEEEFGSEGEGADPMGNVQAHWEAPEALKQQLAALRGRLTTSALSDEEALRQVSEADSSRMASASTAHRARLSKLAGDLKKVLGTGSGGGGAGGEDAAVQSFPSGLNFERADAVLADFCKVLSQSQREADFALVLKLGCAGQVVDICLRVKDSLAIFAATNERTVSPAWRQISNVMLSALKWLGLVCKHDFARVFMLLTNRVVVFADVALACLETHFRSASALPDPQNASVLFLPQVLHVLSLHVKQALPEPNESNSRTLVSYLLLCGLSEKLRELLRRAEIRGLRLFDGASPVPLLLLRAMGFLCNVISAYRAPTEAICADAAGGGEPAVAAAPAVMDMLRRTELFGIVSVLVSILLSEGARLKTPGPTAVKLPQTVISLAFQAVRILNSIARLHLSTFQETLGANCRRQELYHLMVSLIDYCTVRLKEAKPGQEKSQEENELLHETIVLLGYYCLQNEENQSIMRYGEGQTLLAKITSLPLHYFMDERGRGVLFPTVLATCFRSEHNLELLRSEMNLSLLRTFLAAHLQKEEAKPADGACSSGFGGRFPGHLWQEALSFFSEEPCAAAGDPGDAA